MNPSVEDSYFLSREALPPATISFFAHIIWGALTAFFPLYAIDQGVANPGIFFSIFAIMLISGRALGGKIFDLYSRERVILPYHLYHFDGHPRFFQNSINVYSRCSDLGDWSCLSRSFFGGLYN